MSDLILDSLQIQGFRVFRHLSIGRLGRVNLIVGKNNVGKSSLLEAIRLYAERGSPVLIWELLRARDESIGTLSPRNSEEEEEQTLALRHLFSERKDIREYPDPIKIGPLDQPSKVLSISVDWWYRETVEGGIGRWQELESDDPELVENRSLRLTVRMGEQATSYPIEPYRARRLFVRPDYSGFKEIPNTFSPANGLDNAAIGRLWDQVALTEAENDVLNAVRILVPEVERVSLVEQRGVRERIPIAKIAGVTSPLRLRSMGEGTNRALGIALALVNARDGLLLIDEFENGLHYTVQADLWRLIFDVAQRLNVQVFATSHSWDCIEAFQEAATNDVEEGSLIQLQMRNGEISATLLNEHTLTLVTREQIEVR